MKLVWKNSSLQENNLVMEWLSADDRQMLCMKDKDWNDTAKDIEECLRYADYGQFKNLIGYLDAKPAVAVMLGVENSGEVLHIYNIAVNPSQRKKGIAYKAVKEILQNPEKFDLRKTYHIIKASILPENKASLKLFNKAGLSNLINEDEYIVASKDLRLQEKYDYDEFTI